MTELTEELARSMERTAQILAGVARLASEDCSWLRDNSELHAELLELQDQLRVAAAEVTGGTELGIYLVEARAVGTQLGTLFQPAIQQTVEAHYLSVS